MATTRTYLDYLNEKIDISPANSQEELDAANLLGGLMEEHGLDVQMQEFDAPAQGGLAHNILYVLMFLGILLAGFIGTIVGYVGLALVLLAFVFLVLEFTGHDVLGNLGPRARSQNVIGVHRATGPNVMKGARPIVIVAHYDSPNEDLLSRPQVARYQPMLKRATMACSVIVPLCALIQLISVLPAGVRHVFWIVGILAGVPLLAVGISAIYQRFAPCTIGANDNKSSVAAMLGVMDMVRPHEDAAKRYEAVHPYVEVQSEEPEPVESVEEPQSPEPPYEVRPAGETPVAAAYEDRAVPISEEGAERGEDAGPQLASGPEREDAPRRERRREGGRSESADENPANKVATFFHNIAAGVGSLGRGKGRIQETYEETTPYDYDEDDSNGGRGDQDVQVPDAGAQASQTRTNEDDASSVHDVRSHGGRGETIAHSVPEVAPEESLFDDHVRRGAHFVESLNILPEDCEIVYQDPPRPKPDLSDLPEIPEMPDFEKEFAHKYDDLTAMDMPAVDVDAGNAVANAASEDSADEAKLDATKTYWVPGVSGEPAAENPYMEEVPSEATGLPVPVDYIHYVTYDEQYPIVEEYEVIEEPAPQTSEAEADVAADEQAPSSGVSTANEDGHAADESSVASEAEQRVQGPRHGRRGSRGGSFFSRALGRKEEPSPEQEPMSEDTGFIPSTGSTGTGSAKHRARLIDLPEIEPNYQRIDHTVPEVIYEDETDETHAADTADAADETGTTEESDATAAFVAENASAAQGAESVQSEPLEEEPFEETHHGEIPEDDLPEDAYQEEAEEAEASYEVPSRVNVDFDAEEAPEGDEEDARGTEDEEEDIVEQPDARMEPAPEEEPTTEAESAPEAEPAPEGLGPTGRDAYDTEVDSGDIAADIQIDEGEPPAHEPSSADGLHEGDDASKEATVEFQRLDVETIEQSGSDADDAYEDAYDDGAYEESGPVEAKPGLGTRIKNAWRNFRQRHAKSDAYSENPYEETIEQVDLTPQREDYAVEDKPDDSYIEDDSIVVDDYEVIDETGIDSGHEEQPEEPAELAESEEHKAAEAIPEEAAPEGQDESEPLSSESYAPEQEDGDDLDSTAQLQRVDNEVLREEYSDEVEPIATSEPEGEPEDEAQDASEEEVEVQPEDGATEAPETVGPHASAQDAAQEEPESEGESVSAEELAMSKLEFSPNEEVPESELAEKDTSGLEADVEDELPPDNIPAPRPIDDPNWGRSEFRPARSNIARRAVLFDLPDPRESTNDPFADSTDDASAHPSAGLDAEPTAEQEADGAGAQHVEVAPRGMREPIGMVSSTYMMETDASRVSRAQKRMRKTKGQQRQPGERRKFSSLFNHKDRQPRTDSAEGQQSMSEWLGVDEDYDAKTSGRKIGSWDNFEKGSEGTEGASGSGERTRGERRGDSWKGGATTRSGFRVVRGEAAADEHARASATEEDEAYQRADADGQPAQEPQQAEGYELYERDDQQYEYPQYDGAQDAQDPNQGQEPSAEDQREAILGMGYEDLIAHDIYFVALGASSLDHAGMRNFLAEHRSDIRGSFLVNLDCVGAGELTFLTHEGRTSTRRSDRRMGRMLMSIAKDLHMHLGRTKYDWGETDATMAMRNSVRVTTIMGVSEDGVPAFSATADDLPENVDPAQVVSVSELIAELIRRS